MRLDHLLDAWSEPSCKAKTDGRYNTNSLAFDDKRAQIASTVQDGGVQARITGAHDSYLAVEEYTTPGS